MTCHIVLTMLNLVGAEDDDDTSVDNGDEVDDHGVNDDDDAGDSGDDSDDSGANNV